MEKKSTNGWGSKVKGLLKPKAKVATAEVVVTPLTFSYSLCVGCSACTLTCRAVRDGVAPPWFEPKQRFLIPLTGEAAKSYPCETCGKCTALCPVGVPLHG